MKKKYVVILVVCCILFSSVVVVGKAYSEPQWTFESVMNRWFCTSKYPWMVSPAITYPGPKQVAGFQLEIEEGEELFTTNEALDYIRSVINEREGSIMGDVEKRFYYCVPPTEDGEMFFYLPEEKLYISVAAPMGKVYKSSIHELADFVCRITY